MWLIGQTAPVIRVFPCLINAHQLGLIPFMYPDTSWVSGGEERVDNCVSTYVLGVKEELASQPEYIADLISQVTLPCLAMFHSHAAGGVIWHMSG